MRPTAARAPNRYPSHRRGGAKSFVDDLGFGRGVVLSRAATSLRSIETKPFDWKICPQSDGHIFPRRQRARDARLPTGPPAREICPHPDGRISQRGGQRAGPTDRARPEGWSAFGRTDLPTRSVVGWRRPPTDRSQQRVSFPPRSHCRRRTLAVFEIISVRRRAEKK